MEPSQTKSVCHLCYGGPVAKVTYKVWKFLAAAGDDQSQVAYCKINELEEKPFIAVKCDNIWKLSDFLPFMGRDAINFVARL